MKKLRIIAIAAFVAVFVGCGSGSTQKAEQATDKEAQVAELNCDKYDLGYKLEVGSTYNQEFTMDTDMKLKTMGQEMAASTASTMVMNFTVTDIVDERIACKVVLTSINILLSLPTDIFSFSSDDESDNSPLSTMLKGMVGSDFTMVMTKYGKTESVVGFDKILDQAYNSLNIPESDIMQLKTVLKQSLSEEMFKEQFQSLAIYPKHPVAVGGSWKVDISNSQMDLAYTYTLQKVSDEEMVIDAEAKVTNMKVNDFSGRLKGTEAGTIVVHRSSGWIKDAIFKRDASGRGTLQGIDNVTVAMKSHIRVSEEYKVSYNY